jgi:hypothetical protein
MNAGAVIVKPAEETFWGGYAGYFQDPDGHLWAVVWNPQWTPQDWGAVGTGCQATGMFISQRTAVLSSKSIACSP